MGTAFPVTIRELINDTDRGVGGFYFFSNLWKASMICW